MISAVKVLLPILLFVVLLLVFVLLPKSDSGDESTKEPLVPTLISTSTGVKPQSKVWFFDDSWWAAFPDDSGAWVWRLDGSAWTSVLHLSLNKNVKVDYELVERHGVVHILLLDGSETQLASIEYVPGLPGIYQFWSKRPALVDVPVSGEAMTATIARDSTSRMWVAYDTSNSVTVRYSDPSDDYSTWSQPIILASGIDRDDIAAIIAFDEKVGVLWSDRETERFGLRIHADTDPPTIWAENEVPASQSASACQKLRYWCDDPQEAGTTSIGSTRAAQDQSSSWTKPRVSWL